MGLSVILPVCKSFSVKGWKSYSNGWIVVVRSAVSAILYLTRLQNFIILRNLELQSFLISLNLISFTFTEASISEEPSAVVPHAGICAGAVGWLAVLPWQPIGPEDFLDQIVEALGIIIGRRPKGRPHKMESQIIEKIGCVYFNYSYSLFWHY